MAQRPLIWSDRARAQARRRGLPEALVLRVATSPDEVLVLRKGREVRQAVVPFAPDDQPYLVRAFVDLNTECETIATVYRTSKLDKYRGAP